MPRAQAHLYTQHQPAQRTGNQVAAGCLAVLTVVTFLSIITYSSCEASPSKARTSKTNQSGARDQAQKQQPATEEQPTKGELGYVGLTSKDTLGADSDYELGEMFKAIGAKDEEGVRQMGAAGSVFEIDAGTQVRVIDSGSSGVRVRFLSGPFADHTGWIADSAL